jgi:serine/threonine protein kinase
VKRQSLKLVRKSFKPNNSGYHERENELRNLATLKLLKDPCIVQLLGSYTYREEHSFLFPLATSGDLAQLLDQEPRPAEFDSDEKFLLALLGLATAIQKIHDFSYGTLNLKLIGCHHDLKPKNVLVHKDRFLLADFGLSKFKPLEDGSKTMFKLGGDYYLAPECEEYEGNFERHTISRPADIWSFGCIIAEIVTYMNGGSEDVRLFKECRRIKIGRLTTCTFHAGYNKPHDQVFSWLSHLEAATTRSGQLLVRLIRKMLSMNPEDRPKAMQVSFQIAYIASYELFQSSKSLLLTIANKAGSFEVEMESLKFECCGSVLGMLEKSSGTAFAENLQHEPRDVDEVFKTANPVSELLQMRDELREIGLLQPSAMRLRILRIRYLVDKFVEKLPTTIRRRAENRLESAIANSHDIQFLQTSKEFFQAIPTYRRIALLASIRRITLLAATRLDLCPAAIRISTEAIQIKDTFETSNLALISREGSHLLEWAIIEWLYYDCDFNEELFIRVEAIAELLGTEKPTEFLGLDCAGFYHDKSKPAFGLAFPYPEQFRKPSSTASPLTLAKFIELGQDAPNRPFLGDRFTLAHRLAVSVLEYHKVGWLHKCLSSFSVMLFYPKNSVFFVPESIKQPFIIGFSHSRPDEPNAYTRGPKENEREEYQHPDYVEHRAPFSARYDYYSLGIILLEIGLWISVVELRQRWKISTARKLRTELINRRVPLLGHSMGQRYCEAVEHCLSYSADNLTESEQLRLNFEQEVIEKLASCSA